MSGRDDELTFPEGFLWGTATSSYQIEGAVAADGRGASIWDVFSRLDGAIRGGDTGDEAADHYHRWKEDLDLLAWLGVGAYRFSIAWPRVQPDGRGPVNQPGLDFYQRLVDGLLERGIEPVVTLYHWDLPHALQEDGGWADRGIVDRFGEYAGIVGAALGDRVRWWATLNEPWCSAFLGYRTGGHAPGLRDDGQAVAAAHHLLLAHGEAIAVLRGELPADAQVGIALNPTLVRPASSAPADIEAARVVDGGRNRLWLDAIFRGRYPGDVLDAWASVADLGVIRDGDLDRIAAPIDWLGINYYHPDVVAAGAPGRGLVEPATDGIVSVSLDGEHTATGWPIDASGLRSLLVRVEREYGRVPILLTENGAAFEDVVSEEGSIDDSARIRYLEAHLREVRASIADGVDLHGYFIWSFLDNFEWAEGYRARFGIVHVDYATQRRTPKASALWYRDVVRRNGLPVTDETVGPVEPRR